MAGSFLERLKTGIDAAEYVSDNGAKKQEYCEDNDCNQNKNEGVLYQSLTLLSQADLHADHLLS